MNRRLVTPVGNRQGLELGLVAGPSAAPPVNSKMGAPKPALAAPSPPRRCRVHEYGPCPARSAGTLLPSPTPTEEEEQEITVDIPARGYGPAPSCVASVGGGSLVFIPTPGRAQTTVSAATAAGASGSADPGPGEDAPGTSSAPWAFGRSPAPPSEQGLFLFGEGGTPTTDVAGTSASAGPPDTGASRRLLFGCFVAAIDRRPGRRTGAWDPTSLGLTANLPYNNDYTPSSDEEDFTPSPPTGRR